MVGGGRYMAINWTESLSVTTQCSKFTELKPEGEEIRLSVFLYNIPIAPPCREPPLAKIQKLITWGFTLADYNRVILG